MRRAAAARRTWRWVLLLAPFWGRAANAAAAFPPATLPAPDPAPALSVVVTPVRESLRLGTDADMEVAIDVAGPGAETFRPIRSLATVGTVEPMRSRGPAHFLARYVPPPDRVPRVAVLAFELGSGAQRVHGWTRVGLEGSTVFPLRTSSGASVTMRVAGQTFGPAVADRQGHVEIPIVVPPGVQRADARAVDRNGESRDTQVDLHLPPYQRVVLLAPEACEAGSLSEVVVVGVDERGEPEPADRLTLAASAGLPHPLGGGPGEARFLFEAPVRTDTPTLTLTASADGPLPSRTDVQVPLRAARPEQLDVDAASDRLIVGEPRSVPVTISARDRYGNRTSAAGVLAHVDGHPQAVEITQAGTAVFWLNAPARYQGRERIDILVELGAARAFKTVRVTGGAPAALTIHVAPGRVVADGRRGTELQVQAIDRNGTPTSVPGLSWETPEGRIRGVRVPRDGEYLAEYVPDRTREAHRELVAVMASETVRAETLVDVTPPPIRVVAGAHAGLTTSFGPSVGPAALLEALVPIRLARVRLFAGLGVGYLRSDVTGRGVQGTGTTHIEVNQSPVLAVGRAGVESAAGFELSAELAAGWSWAWVHVSSMPQGLGPDDASTANAPALGSAFALSYPLRPGRLALGLRYLWIALDRTSLGDRLSGNSAGMVADLGYEMTF
ncbi:MAG TPA: hypothetical protein VHO67_02370 [Polyangia bacterium]|nr:hypothetical protein [Polyangia bacterium]